jgi:hypothetical protein
MANTVYGHMANLNAASTYTTILTGAGAKNAALTIGKTYRFQPQGGDVRIGFGATAAAADTDAASGKGEILTDGTVQQFTVTTDATKYIARTSVASDTDVIIRECIGA